MRSTMRDFFTTRPLTAGIVAAVAIVLVGASLVAAKPLIKPFINGTISYVSNTSGPVIQGDNTGSGIGVEGVTDTTAAVGAIAVEGIGTSTTHASIGVVGAVAAPGSTALIGNANAVSGAASVGLEGFAANGEGVLAESTSSGFPSLRSVDASDFFDVKLSDVPNHNAVTATLGTSVNGAAILGQDTVTVSDENSGVVGTTLNGLYGVEGNAGGLAVAGVNGVAGTDSQIGVTGFSASGGGIGVQGNSVRSPGVGVDGMSSMSGVGGAFSSMGGDGAVGMTSGNGSDGVLGTGSGSPGTFGVFGAGSTAGVAAQCASDGHSGTGTDMIIGYDSSLVEHYTVDCSGTVSTFLKTRHGLAAQVYAPRDASATLEDEGEAQLVSGSAAVRLDATFADSMSDQSNYLVFITPQGDSRGLFVTHKTPAGFEVHESMGGHSTLAFDYRIVAKPNGVNLAHMPLFASPNSVSNGHPVQPSLTMLAITKVQNATAKWAATKAGARVRTIHLTNIYEPRMGPNGKLYSVPIKFTNVVAPY